MTILRTSNLKFGFESVAGHLVDRMILCLYPQRLCQPLLHFSITAESMNEMLHFHSTEPLAPLSMGLLLENASQLPSSEITRIAQMFMKPNCQPQGPPPYLHTLLTETGKLILDMKSLILGFKSSKYVEYVWRTTARFAALRDIKDKEKNV